MTSNTKTWFKVIGHRPFDNNCQSTNIICADSSSDAKASMEKFYGSRNDDDDNGKPNVIVDEVISLSH